MISEDEKLAVNLSCINKCKLAVMFYVFKQRVNTCQSVHDATMLMIEAEKDINELFFDIAADQTYAIEKLMILNFAALAVIDWNLPPNLMKKEIQEARENAKKALPNDKTFN